MAKVFTPFVTVIPADWLNPVSVLTEDVFLKAINALEARTAIFACEESPDDIVIYGRQARGWVPVAGFLEAPLDGISYARQKTGDEVDPDACSWTRSQRVYVQATDPAL